MLIWTSNVDYGRILVILSVNTKFNLLSHPGLLLPHHIVARNYTRVLGLDILQVIPGRGQYYEASHPLLSSHTSPVLPAPSPVHLRVPQPRLTIAGVQEPLAPVHPPSPQSGLREESARQSGSPVCGAPAKETLLDQAATIFYISISILGSLDISMIKVRMI